MKIQNKFFFILFSFSLVLVTVLVLLMQWSIGKGMVEYVNTKEQQAIQPLIIALQVEYQKNDDWSGIAGKNRKFSDLVFTNLKGSGFLLPAPETHRPRLDQHMEFNDFPPDFPMKENGLPFPEFDKATWYGLLDSNENLLVGQYSPKGEFKNSPIIVDNQTVGFLAVPNKEQVMDGYELDFIEQQQSYLWLFSLITLVLVALVTLPLARHVLAPVNRIAHGMHLLTQGEYKQKIVLQRKDELGQLIRDFNELALTLDENESARKRWLANISHELRTPVAILRGELEAMLDGVRPMNADNIGSSNDEVKHLQSLIDDLHQLTSADIGGMHYRKKQQDLNAWLTSESKKYSSYLADAGITLETQISATAALVFFDPTRLCQLFENIINNCVKYSQASRVKISAQLDSALDVPSVVVCIEDNGVGVAPQHMDKLFEYLYRVDDSRNRKTGGTGLGLSICAHIAAAHQGTISAKASTLGGLAIIIRLPIS